MSAAESRKCLPFDGVATRAAIVPRATTARTMAAGRTLENLSGQLQRIGRRLLLLLLLVPLLVVLLVQILDIRDRCRPGVEGEMNQQDQDPSSEDDRRRT